MTNIPQIDSFRVNNALISQPHGKYILRAKNENDDIISRIRISSRTVTSENTTPCRYAILSVRVDETVYPCHIMHYHLPMEHNGEEDRTKLLEQYYRNQENSPLDKLPMLTDELPIKTEKNDWKIDIDILGICRNKYFKPSSLKGQFNDGVKKTICDFRHDKTKTKIFLKKHERERQTFEHESLVLQKLCFFHIISYYGYYSNVHGTRYMVFAYGGKQLKKQCPIQDNPEQPMMDQIINIGYQIACGMVYLEEKKIIHRDLHAENILIDEYGFIRVADFGHAILKNDNDFREKIRYLDEFKIRLMAPECLLAYWNGRKKQDYDHFYHSFSSKSDVWAFGLIFIEITMKDSELYPDKTDTEVKDHVLQKKIHDIPENFSENMHQILQQCWAYHPENRISFLDARNELLNLLESDNN